MTQKTNQPEEEINYTQFFNLIEKLFVVLNQFVKNLIGFIYQGITKSFDFLVKNFLKVVGAGLIGVIIGFVADYNAAPEYYSTMVVKPNYQSGRQLYKNIAYYNELVKQGNVSQLEKIFLITNEEAESITGFYIEPVIEENELLSSFGNYIKSIDSVSALNMDYESYKENYPLYAYKQQLITVEATNNKIFKSLENNILNDIVNNQYFKSLEDSENEIIDRNTAYLSNSLENIDSLRTLYNKVILLEAQKEESSGTNINMASIPEGNKEVDLFVQERTVNEKLDQIGRLKVDKTEIINVVSNFQSTGFEKRSLLDKSATKIGVFAMLLMFLVLVVLEIRAIRL